MSYKYFLNDISGKKDLKILYWLQWEQDINKSQLLVKMQTSS